MKKLSSNRTSYWSKTEMSSCRPISKSQFQGSLGCVGATCTPAFHIIQLFLPYVSSTCFNHFKAFVLWSQLQLEASVSKATLGIFFKEQSGSNASFPKYLNTTLVKQNYKLPSRECTSILQYNQGRTLNDPFSSYPFSYFNHQI